MNGVIVALQEAIGSAKVLAALEDRVAYSYDGTFAQELPDVIVLPESTDEVAAVVRIAAAHRVPVVPRGMPPAWPRLPCPSAGVSPSR